MPSIYGVSKMIGILSKSLSWTNFFKVSRPIKPLSILACRSLCESKSFKESFKCITFILSIIFLSINSFLNCSYFLILYPASQI